MQVTEYGKRRIESPDFLIVFLVRQRKPYKRICPLCKKKVRGRETHSCPAGSKNVHSVKWPRWAKAWNYPMELQA